VARLRDSNRSLSRNDVRIIVMAQLLRELSQVTSSAAALDFLEDQAETIEAAINSLAV